MRFKRVLADYGSQYTASTKELSGGLDLETSRLSYKTNSVKVLVNSIFGQGFDSPQLHYLVGCKCITFSIKVC